MKKIYLYTMFAAALLASCSDFEPDYSNLSDKNIRFRVMSGTDSRACATDSTQALQQPLVATTSDGSTLYLHPMVQSIERLEQLQREAAASYTNPKGILKESRAALTTENLTAFNVIATRYAAGALGTTAPNFIYVETATKSGAGYWETTVPYLWPANNDKLAFFAYAPGDGAGINLSSASQQGAPTIDFQVQNNPADQIDLITASAIDCTNQAQARNGVSLTFSHMLTSVKFVLASELTGTLKSVTLRGLYTSAKYVYPSAANTAGTWNFSGKNVGSITFDYTGATPAEVSLFLIPQSFGEDASVEAVYNNGTKDITLSASLKNQEWTAGSSVIYKISDSAVNTLKIANITFPTLSHPGLPKIAYADGDKVGIYVVDAQGNIITNNAMLTYDGNEWSTYAVMPFSLEYDYYLYYPYSSAGLANTSNTTSGAKSVSRATTETAGEATSFFAPGIDAWTPTSNQSTSNNFIASDLHIAKGKLSSADATNIDFNMTHAMGLAQFDLGTKNIGQEYYLSTDANYKWFVGSGGTATATSSFATGGYQPYGYATGKYLVWVKPNTATSINSAAELTDSWENALTFNVAANTISNRQTAYSARTTSGSSTQYTLQVGDYLYSDGSFAHSSSMPTATAARHPIAVVFSTTTSSTDNAAGYKSGYAIALASAGAQLTWCKSGIGAASASVNSAVTTLAAAKTDLDGRTKTNVVVSRSDFSKANYPSFYYATHFGTSEIGLTSGTGSSSTEASGGSAGYAAPTGTTVKNSGWYLGSIGQYYLVAKNLGGNIDNPSSTWTEGSSHNFWYVCGVSQANKTTLEGYFSAGSNTWAPSFGMPWSSGQYATWYWTSSEFSASNGFYVVWDYDGNFHLNGPNAKSYTNTKNRGVRAVIAF